MIRRRLGRTGLEVSVLGLGTGTRFGDGRNTTPAERLRLVRGALDLGVNYIDVAPMYLEAESFLGEALAGVPREQYLLATKFFPADPSGAPFGPEALRASVETSLRRLRVESVDVLQLHGVRPAWLGPVLGRLGSELEALKQAGKYRFLGVTETIVEDPRHAMLPAATETGHFSQALVGYSLLSPWAELEALPACAQAGVGVVAMVVVPRGLRDPAFLAQLIAEACARGEPGVVELAADDPLGWLRDLHSPTLPAAGYRYAVAHPAIATVLAGTLSLDHLRANVAAVNAPPPPAETQARIRSVFLRTDPERWVLRNI